MRGAVTDHRSALAKSLTRARAEKDAEMERELARLREENARLREENARLRTGGLPQAAAAPQQQQHIQWADAPGAPGTQPRNLERLRSYSPGEYKGTLPASPQGEAEPEPSEASVSFASDDVGPARRRRLMSYSVGEYSDALSAQDSSTGGVSFSQDAADEPLPQRRQRLKSYSVGEYSDALSTQDSSTGGVSFSQDAADEPLPQRRQRLKSYSKGEYLDALSAQDSSASAVSFSQDAADEPLPQRRQRLKSYSKGEYAAESLEQSASSAHSVSFAVEEQPQEDTAAAAAGRRLRRLKSFDPGEYHGVLTPEEQFRQNMAARRSGKHLWGVARGTMAMAVGLPMAVARPIEKFDPSIAVAEAVVVGGQTAEPSSSGDAGRTSQLNHATPAFHPGPTYAGVDGDTTPMDDESSGSSVQEHSLTYRSLLQAEEEEHQAELRRIGSGEMPLGAAAPASVASSPTKVSDWPSSFAGDVAVRESGLGCCASMRRPFSSADSRWRADCACVCCCDRRRSWRQRGRKSRSSNERWRSNKSVAVFERTKQMKPKWGRPARCAWASAPRARRRRRHGARLSAATCCRSAAGA
jgi:hypothetical protein